MGMRNPAEFANMKAWLASNRDGKSYVFFAEQPPHRHPGMGRWVTSGHTATCEIQDTTSVKAPAFDEEPVAMDMQTAVFVLLNNLSNAMEQFDELKNDLENLKRETQEEIQYLAKSKADR
jgi:hypothetical protein